MRYPGPPQSADGPPRRSNAEVSRLGLSLLALSWMVGCVPFASPGVKADVAGWAETGSAKRHGLHVSGGVHLASIASNDAVPFDAGLGYVLDQAFWGQSSHGLYLEAAARLQLGVPGRMFLGGRLELATPMGRLDFALYGVSARASYELFSPVRVDGPGEGKGNLWVLHARGNGGAGLFVEAGYRHWARDGRESFFGIVGVTVRVPLAVGLMVFGLR